MAGMTTRFATESRDPHPDELFDEMQARSQPVRGIDCR